MQWLSTLWSKVFIMYGDSDDAALQRSERQAITPLKTGVQWKLRTGEC